DSGTGTRHRQFTPQKPIINGNYHLAEQEEQFDQPNSEDEAEEREYQQQKQQRVKAKQLKNETKERLRCEKNTRKQLEKEAKLLRPKTKKHQSILRAISHHNNNNTNTISNIKSNQSPEQPSSEKDAVVATTTTAIHHSSSCVVLPKLAREQTMPDWNQLEMDHNLFVQAQNNTSEKRSSEQYRDRAPPLVGPTADTITAITKQKGYLQQIWSKIRLQRRRPSHGKQGKQVQDYWGDEKKARQQHQQMQQQQLNHPATTSQSNAAPIEQQQQNLQETTCTTANSLSKSESRNTTATTGTMTTAESISIRSSLQASQHQNSSGLFDQETTRTWRGLFAAVRQLSHSASTTGSSSHTTSSSSSATSISSMPGAPIQQQRQKTCLDQPLKHSKRLLGVGPSKVTGVKEAHCPLGTFNIGDNGDGAVGKSAMALRFLRDQFLDEYDPTIEDSYCKHVEVDGQEYTLDITDTAGQEEYRGQWNEAFMKAADGFICIYSIESLQSFKGLVGLRDQIWTMKETQQVPMIVAANKCDLELEREVSQEAGQAFATESNAFFAETSAKTGFNIQEMVVELVRAIAKNSRKFPPYRDTTQSCSHGDKMLKDSQQQHSRHHCRHNSQHLHPIPNHGKGCNNCESPAAASSLSTTGMLSPHSAACAGNGRCCRVM
ncbi:Ras GTPase, partial [Podila humilis]